MLIVDDRLITVGSANCTNRSMSFDSELNMVWEDTEGAELSAGIAHIRASLLCEHAGIAYDPALAESTGLVARLDALLGHSKLRLFLRLSNGGSKRSELELRAGMAGPWPGRGGLSAEASANQDRNVTLTHLPRM